MLELDVIADRLIGSDEEGGLSLEQRKRTTLGVELAANPSLIFLDEPTSGLDARSAQVIPKVIAHFCLLPVPRNWLLYSQRLARFGLVLAQSGGSRAFEVSTCEFR